MRQYSHTEDKPIAEPPSAGHSRPVPFLSRAWVGVLLIALPVLAFAAVWVRYAVNVPKWDDHALRFFLYSLGKETTVSGKFYQLVKQHNEHRIVYDRLIAWLDQLLFGELGFTRLMVVGNVSLLGLVGLFWLVLRKELAGPPAQLLWYLAPVAFMLINLSHWENMYWAMAALQNLSLVLWVLGTIYLLAYTEHRLAAFGLAVLATLTSGNGLMVWPIGVLLLAAQALEQPKNRKALLWWTVGTAVTIGLYFWGYQKPEGNPPVRSGVVALIKGGLAFNGAAAEAFSPTSPFVASILFGGILTGFSILLVLMIFRRRLAGQSTRPLDYFLTGCLLFLLGTAAIVAWSRAGFGNQVLITSRYKIYSLALMALLYTYTVASLNGRRQQGAGMLGLLAGVFLSWTAYLSYLDDTIYLRRFYLASQFNWTYETNQLNMRSRPALYQPAFYEGCLNQMLQPATAAPLKVDTVYQNGGTFVIQSRALTSGLDPLDEQYVRLQSGKRTYLFAANPLQNGNRLVWLGLAPIFLPGIQTFIPAIEPAPDRYRIDLVTADPSGNCRVHPTDRTLTVAPPPTGPLEKNW